MPTRHVSREKYSDNDLALFVVGIEQISRRDTLKSKQKQKPCAFYVEDNISYWQPEEMYLTSHTFSSTHEPEDNISYCDPEEIASTSHTMASIHEAKDEFKQEKEEFKQENSTDLETKPAYFINELYRYASAPELGAIEYGEPIADLDSFEYIDPTEEIDSMERSISDLRVIEYEDILSCQTNISYSLPLDWLTPTNLVHIKPEEDDSHIYMEPYETLIERSKRKLAKLKLNFIKKCKKYLPSKTYKRNA